MSTLTLKVPEILNNQLSSYAKEKGLNKSEIVRLALMEYFSKDQLDASNSFLSLSKDLAGTVDGPSDLSINQSHLENYGK